jgi:hypothetical protein
MRALRLATACALAVGVAPAAGSPGRNGAIAFAGARDGGRAIYVRAHGRTIALLRGDSLGDPAYSPRGQRLAVTRALPDVGRGVWILGVDGSALRQLTPPENAGEDPTWAPAGRTLAYAAGPHGQRTIHVIRADGTGDRQLTAGPADQFSPAWSPTGEIAFVQADPGGDDVYTVSPTGGRPRRLTSKPGDDTSPAWSPDGRRIAFVRGRGGIWVMNALGGAARRVVHVPGGFERGVAWSPDGRRLGFAGGPPGARRIYSVRLDGKGLVPLSLPGSDGRDPDWRSVGHDPMIAAAGDVACAPEGRSFHELHGTPHYCGMLRTSNLLLQPDLWAVLALGDLQYPVGDIGRFYTAFHPSWGRLKPLIRPAAGNHEYATPGASGYFDYFDGAGEPTGRAGNRERGYYSFDVGTWHLVALNSNCGSVPGGCAMGSPQQHWLASDLQRHHTRCILAFWHHPLFSSLAHEEGRGWKSTAGLWQTLADARADIVLSGHQHFYERLAPMDAAGNLDAAQGIRSFVVGTGGKSLDHADVRASNSVAYDDTTFGVLELTLHPRSYHWRFRAADGRPFSDAGSAVCHR